MLFVTTLDQFKEFARQSKRVVVSHEIYADMITPVRVFQCLAKGHEQAVLLDSSDHATAQDACIYIGLDPVAEFKATESSVTVSDLHSSREVQGDVFNCLRDFYNDYKSLSQHSLAKFGGGMIGFMGHDSLRFIEDIPSRHPSDQLPVMNFKFYGTNIAFDKRTGKALVTKVVEVTEDVESCYQRAIKDIEHLIQQMLNAQVESVYVRQVADDDPFKDILVDSDDKQFKSMVAQVQDYIKCGDVFQVVLSRRFQKKFSGDDFDLYRALRVLNPSPYQFYIRDADYTVVGSSPEKLVSLQDHIIESTPIAGTRPRGQDFNKDQQIEQELLADEKEVAEHMMLIDLARNDVGSVSKVGSVKVVEEKQIKRFSSVMHMSSTVHGEIAEGLDAFDVMKHSFPAGTLSGAPKIRALEIIDEIEASPRGVYGGAIMAVDNQGQMDSCIVIRTIVLQHGLATVRAGAGIVFDSDPQTEADETRHKATAALKALQVAERGLI